MMPTGNTISTSPKFDGNSSTCSINSLPSSRRTANANANTQLLGRALSHQQQTAEAHRNKGVICKNYFESHRQSDSVSEANPPPPCFMGNLCPYSHIADGDTLPLPESVCNFHMRSKCLRDNCGYFHGKRQLLDDIKAKLIAEFHKTHGPDAAVPKLHYRPQDYLSQQLVPQELRIENILALLRQQDQQQTSALAPPPQLQIVQQPMLAPAGGFTPTRYSLPMFPPHNPAPYGVGVAMVPQFVPSMPQYYHSQQPTFMMQQPTPMMAPQVSLMAPPPMPVTYQPMYSPFPHNPDPNMMYVYDPRSGMTSSVPQPGLRPSH